MKTLYISLAALFLTFTVNAQIISIPDANFKAALIAEGVDTNSDGEIQVSEAEAETGLRVNNQSISSLVGIEYFTNLDFLFCHDNQLTSLDVSVITTPFSLYCYNNLLTSLNFGSNIRSIACNNNQLTSLDLSSAINLQGLECGNNQLTTLDLSNQTEAFTALDCYGNSLTTLDIEHLTMLSWLTCDGNQLTSLNLSSNPSIGLLSASLNQLTNIDTSNLTDLVHLGVDDNFLTHLDISNNGAIRRLYCDNNQLVSLNLKNGTLNYNEFAPDDDYELHFENNPDLEFICADYSGYGISPGEEIDIVQDLIDTYGYTNCYVSSYCSFVPGGTFYAVEGTTRLDLDANGCDVADNVYPQLNFSIGSSNFISDSSGNYFIPVQAGTRTITPILENPDYFTVSPTEITVSFPTDSSPFMQDFCVTPNGSFNDLEITIIPVEAAHPGFDTNYKIVYKNNGNTTLSGNINFAFEDDVTTFVSSTPPNESGVPDLLQYSFTDLLPFESRVIDVVMNLNAPTDTPSLNDGDILTFNTSIEYSGTDETPDDNMFTLNQTVVNSFDPNDKTCLEGEYITPEMVGDYVHYMIRFENTGSADAINIVVKDHIDITKYDLSSLVPTDASHDFFAKIKDDAPDHYIEFIFENINLPFDDANNDGYIVFKIKTLDTLVLDDTIENEAEIYFDFNFPIITNIAQTTIATLGVDDFEFEANISIYPNPVQSELFINSKDAIERIRIYDLSGRLIHEKSIIGNQLKTSILIEKLSSSVYFISVKTAQYEFTKRMVKN
ncbi:T9SS type A sorting domain-containing protein [Oceanihabitans sp.]|nr:T9SS type A sorting domain-containing protein [Oceanihabitans sp.]